MGCSVDQPWEHERSERLRPKAPGRCSIYTEGPEQASPGTDSRVAAVGAGRVRSPGWRGWLGGVGEWVHTNNTIKRKMTVKEDLLSTNADNLK